MFSDLTPQEAQFRDRVRAFAQERLAPTALERAHEPHYPWDTAKLLADEGLLGLTVPKEDGGQGATLMEAVIAIQEIGLACPKSADVVQAGNFGALRTFAEYASEEQKARYLPGLLSGQSLLALGMSEPETGSAITDLHTTATRDGDEVVINGTKVWSGYSADAPLFLVYVRFGPGVGGIGSVIVERDTPGFEVGEASAYMSGELWAPLRFTDCRIPASKVLLGEGGFKRQISGFNVERIGNAARSLALAQLAFEIARDHVAAREQFGRPLMEFQGLQWKFAEMSVALDGAQLLLERAARGASGGLPSAYETAVAKLASNETGFKVTHEAMQAMGALGFSSKSLVEYCFRRTRGWMIAGGSTEILKNRIAEHVFDRRFSQRPS